MITDSSKFIPYVRKILLAFFLIGACLIVVYLLSGCGKTGYPVPPGSARTFEWEETDAQMAGNCIAFTGSFSGAYENFDGVLVELDILSGPEDCPGCPFDPEEVAEISPAKAGFNRDKGTIGFSYCPQPAAAYRWRLAGISRYSRMPHATMNDRLLLVPSRLGAAAEKTGP